jgi:hypothetical protein
MIVVAALVLDRGKLVPHFHPAEFAQGDPERRGRRRATEQFRRPVVLGNAGLRLVAGHELRHRRKDNGGVTGDAPGFTRPSE